jgi:hypothetical protein
MKSDLIAVSLRLSTKADSKVKAFADVTVPLGDDGTITVLGFSILEAEGRPTRVIVRSEHLGTQGSPRRARRVAGRETGELVARTDLPRPGPPSMPTAKATSLRRDREQL